MNLEHWGDGVWLDGAWVPESWEEVVEEEAALAQVPHHPVDFVLWGPYSLPYALDWYRKSAVTAQQKQVDQELEEMVQMYYAARKAA